MNDKTNNNIPTDSTDVPRAYLDLVRNLSHELRTPLSTIIGFADMMENELFGTLGSPVYREYASDIQRAGRSIMDAIDDLFDTARFQRFRASETDFRYLIELAPDLICICREGVIELINPAGASMLGLWPVDTLVGRKFVDFVHPDFRDLVGDTIQDLLAEKLRVPLKLHRSDNIDIDVEVAALPYKDDGNRETGAVMLMARDVTERNRALRAVASREENLRMVMNTVADGIVTIDENGVIEMVNAAAAKMFGLEIEDMIGRGIASLMPSPHPLATRPSQGAETPEDNGGAGLANFLGITREVIGKRRDGSEFPIEMVVSELHIGATRRFIAAVRDITARKNFEDRLRYLATRDTLTGLPNRNLFMERLEAATQNCDEGGTRIAVCYADLDQFQNINDAFGHEAGDAVIKAASERL